MSTKKVRRSSTKKTVTSKITVSSKSATTLRRIFWEQQSFFIWLIVVSAIIIFAPIIIAFTISQIMPPFFATKIVWFNNVSVFSVTLTIIEILTIGFVVVWGKHCFTQIGSAKIPCQAVLFRFGKAMYAVGDGLFFHFHPFEEFKLLPKTQYKFPYSIKRGLYSKEESKLRSQPMEVDLYLYLRLPLVGKEYSFFKEKDKNGAIAWDRVLGERLLVEHFAPRLPIINLMVASASEALRQHLEGAILGGVRHVLSIKTSQQCKEEKEPIETGIKEYLLSEIGDPFVELGIPLECLGIEIYSLKFPDDTEQAYKEPELAMKRAEAAEYNQQATRKNMEVLVKEYGTDANVAAAITGNPKGGGATMDWLRDFAIFNGMLRKEKGSAPVVAGPQYMEL
jgi:hypothetical protein